MTTSTIPEAQRLRDEAAAGFKASADSFERCDTDGFLSQWASDITARLKLRQAEIIEAGGTAEFPALFDATTGERIPAKLIDGRFGLCWAFVDPTTRKFTGEFVGALSRGKKARERRGVVEGKEIAPAWAKIDAPKGARGLGGAASAFVRTFRKDDGTGLDPAVRPVVPTSSPEDGDSVGVGAKPTGKASTPTPAATPGARPTWAEVLEANEFFDGEPEVTAAAKAAWLDGKYDR